jgi:hypothetical protein
MEERLTNSSSEIAPSPNTNDLSRVRRIGGYIRKFFSWGDLSPAELEEARLKSKDNPHYPYPDAIEIGGAAYGSNLPFSADWRQLLPEGDPDRPTDPSEFIGHNDPEYRAVLRLLCQVPIDGVNNTGRRSY